MHRLQATISKRAGFQTAEACIPATAPLAGMPNKLRATIPMRLAGHQIVHVSGPSLPP